MTAGILAALAWGTFAFGGVYPWAYIPLLAVCATIGITALASRNQAVPRLANGAPLWLAVAAAAVLVQLVPLPAAVLARISPATDAFLRSYRFSYSADAAFSHPLSLDPASTWLAFAFLVALGLFLAGVMRTLSSRRVRSIARSLIAMGVLLAVIGIAQKALSDHEARLVKLYGFWKPQGFGNPFGPFVNRNHFGGWMLMVLPVALAYFAGVLEEALRDIAPGFRNRLLWSGSERAGQAITIGFSVLVMAAALVYSGSRSGLACAGLAVALIGWMTVRGQMKRSMRVATGAVFVLFLAGALVWAGSDLAWQRFTLVPEQGAERIAAWRDAIRIIRDFPLFGTGLNTYGTATLLYQTVNSPWQYQQAHNDYLQLAAEGGLLVALPALLAAIALVRQIRGRWRERLDDPLMRWLRAGASLSLVSIALQSLVEFSLQIPANAILFAIVAGIAVHQPEHTETGRRGAQAAAMTACSQPPSRVPASR